jgi:hypothetical protein
MLVPGKEFLTQLNIYLQSEYSISITESLIIDCLDKNAFDESFLRLLSDMDEFCKLK